MPPARRIKRDLAGPRADPGKLTLQDLLQSGSSGDTPKKLYAESSKMWFAATEQKWKK